jgi:hypothetical protein
MPFKKQESSFETQLQTTVPEIKNRLHKIAMTEQWPEMSLEPTYFCMFCINIMELQ